MNQKFVSNSNYVLRKVLNKENSLDIIKNFIESILNIKIKNIELNRYLTNMQNYLPKEENFGIADVRILTIDDEELNVGIQFIDGKYIMAKMLLYYAQIHLNQENYNDNRSLCKTITINLLDFNYFKSKSYYQTIYLNSNSKNSKVISKLLEMKIIELPKLNTISGKDLSEREKWILYLKGYNDVKNKNEFIYKLDNLLEDYWNKEKME